MPQLIKYVGPWGGIVSDLPETALQPNQFPVAHQVFSRYGELLSQPQFPLTSSLPSIVDAPIADEIICVGYLYVGFSPIVYVISPTKFAYYNGTVWVVSNLTAVPHLPYPKTPISYNGILYFCDASQIYNFDGTTLSVGSVIAAAVYQGQLANHHILASTIEDGLSIPYRVRWSASGLPNELDPTVNTNAGFNDLTAITDVISGYATLGTSGYVFKRNGMLEMIPTGNGIQPFDFKDVIFSNESHKGVGCFYPFSLADDGLFGYFVGQSNVYRYSPYTGLETIGDNVTKAIFTDIAAAAANLRKIYFASTDYPQLIGSYVDSWGTDYPYPCYIISIPLAQTAPGYGGETTNGSVALGYTVLWIYSIRDGAWNRITTGNGPITAHITELDFVDKQEAIAAFYEPIIPV